MERRKILKITGKKRAVVKVVEENNREDSEKLEEELLV